MATVRVVGPPALGRGRWVCAGQRGDVAPAPACGAVTQRPGVAKPPRLCPHAGLKVGAPRAPRGLHAERAAARGRLPAPGVQSWRVGLPARGSGYVGSPPWPCGPPLASHSRWAGGDRPAVPRPAALEAAFTTSPLMTRVVSTVWPDHRLGLPWGRDAAP